MKFYGKYLYLRLKYKIGIGDYFEHSLYDDKSHEEYYSSLHFVIHKWKNVKKTFEPNKSKIWELIHYCDYLISKIVCPGLDAMDYYRYEFYNLSWNKRKTFITEGEVIKLNNYFNGKKECKILLNKFKNKDEFNTIFSDYIKRKWIKTINIQEKDILNFCDKLEKVIIKPLDGGGGKGIQIIDVRTKYQIQSLYSKISGKNYLLEEVIEQHQVLSELNPFSVNTIRVYSISINDEIKITGATLRIGRNKEPVDNYSRGGFAAEIDIESGIVVSRAVTQFGESVYIHPLTKKNIIGINIPNWEIIKKEVKKAHSLVKSVGYIGWDVVVSKNEEVLFLEANTCAGVELQQHPGLNGKKNMYFNYINKKWRLM